MDRRLNYVAHYRDTSGNTCALVDLSTMSEEGARSMGEFVAFLSNNRDRSPELSPSSIIEVIREDVKSKFGSKETRFLCSDRISSYISSRVTAWQAKLHHMDSMKTSLDSVLTRICKSVSFRNADSQFVFETESHHIIEYFLCWRIKCNDFLSSSSREICDWIRSDEYVTLGPSQMSFNQRIMADILRTKYFETIFRDDSEPVCQLLRSLLNWNHNLELIKAVLMKIRSLSECKSLRSLVTSLVLLSQKSNAYVRVWSIDALAALCRQSVSVVSELRLCKVSILILDVLAVVFTDDTMILATLRLLNAIINCSNQTIEFDIDPFIEPLCNLLQPVIRERLHSQDVIREVAVIIRCLIARSSGDNNQELKMEPAVKVPSDTALRHQFSHANQYADAETLRTEAAEFVLLSNDKISHAFLDRNADHLMINATFAYPAIAEQLVNAVVLLLESKTDMPKDVAEQQRTALRIALALRNIPAKNCEPLLHLMRSFISSFSGNPAGKQFLLEAWTCVLSLLRHTHNIEIQSMASGESESLKSKETHDITEKHIRDVNRHDLQIHKTPINIGTLSECKPSHWARRARLIEDIQKMLEQE